MLTGSGIWVGEGGMGAEMQCHADTADGVMSIMGTVWAFSQAANTKVNIIDSRVGFGASENTGPYTSVQEVADLQFTNHTSGGVFHLLVPACYQGMFMTDTETVDPAVIDPIINAMTTFGLMPSGVAIDTYIKGFRRFIVRGRMLG